MTIREISARTEELLAALTALWEASVRSSHDFLSEEEILKIKEYVPHALAVVDFQDLADGTEAEPHILQGGDPCRRSQLIGAVIAVAAKGIHRRRDQQTNFIVMAQHTNAHSG